MASLSPPPSATTDTPPPSISLPPFNIRSPDSVPPHQFTDLAPLAVVSEGERVAASELLSERLREGSTFIDFTERSFVHADTALAEESPPLCKRLCARHIRQLLPAASLSYDAFAPATQTLANAYQLLNDVDDLGDLNAIMTQLQQLLRTFGSVLFTVSPSLPVVPALVDSWGDTKLGQAIGATFAVLCRPVLRIHRTQTTAFRSATSLAALEHIRDLCARQSTSEMRANTFAVLLFHDQSIAVVVVQHDRHIRLLHQEVADMRVERHFIRQGSSVPYLQQLLQRQIPGSTTRSLHTILVDHARADWWLTPAEAKTPKLWAAARTGASALTDSLRNAFRRLGMDTPGQGAPTLEISIKWALQTTDVFETWSTGTWYVPPQPFSMVPGSPLPGAAASTNLAYLFHVGRCADPLRSMENQRQTHMPLACNAIEASLPSEKRLPTATVRLHPYRYVGESVARFLVDYLDHLSLRNETADARAHHAFRSAPPPEKLARIERHATIVLASVLGRMMQTAERRAFTPHFAAHFWGKAVRLVLRYLGCLAVFHHCTDAADLRDKMLALLVLATASPSPSTETPRASFLVVSPESVLWVCMEATEQLEPHPSKWVRDTYGTTPDPTLTPQESAASGVDPSFAPARGPPTTVHWNIVLQDAVSGLETVTHKHVALVATDAVEAVRMLVVATTGNQPCDIVTIPWGQGIPSKSLRDVPAATIRAWQSAVHHNTYATPRSPRPVTSPPASSTPPNNTPGSVESKTDATDADPDDANNALLTPVQWLYHASQLVLRGQRLNDRKPLKLGSTFHVIWELATKHYRHMFLPSAVHTAWRVQAPVWRLMALFPGAAFTVPEFRPTDVDTREHETKHDALVQGARTLYTLPFESKDPLELLQSTRTSLDILCRYGCIATTHLWARLSLWRFLAPATSADAAKPIVSVGKHEFGGQKPRMGTSAWFHVCFDPSVAAKDGAVRNAPVDALEPKRRDMPRHATAPTTVLDRQDSEYGTTQCMATVPTTGSHAPDAALRKLQDSTPDLTVATKLDLAHALLKKWHPILLAAQHTFHVIGNTGPTQNSNDTRAMMRMARRCHLAVLQLLLPLAQAGLQIALVLSHLPTATVRVIFTAGMRRFTSTSDTPLQRRVFAKGLLQEEVYARPKFLLVASGVLHRPFSLHTLSALQTSPFLGLFDPTSEAALHAPSWKAVRTLTSVLIGYRAIFGVRATTDHADPARSVRAHYDSTCRRAAWFLPHHPAKDRASSAVLFLAPHLPPSPTSPSMPSLRSELGYWSYGCRFPIHAPSALMLPMQPSSIQPLLEFVNRLHNSSDSKRTPRPEERVLATHRTLAFTLAQLLAPFLSLDEEDIITKGSLSKVHTKNSVVLLCTPDSNVLECWTYLQAQAKANASRARPSPTTTAGLKKLDKWLTQSITAIVEQHPVMAPLLKGH